MSRASTSFLPTQSKSWMAGSRSQRRASRFCPAMTENVSNQILLGDDLTQPRVIRNEFLDEFMDAVLEDIVHMAVFKAVADAAGLAPGRDPAGVGHGGLVAVERHTAVAALQPP